MALATRFDFISFFYFFLCHTHHARAFNLALLQKHLRFPTTKKKVFSVEFSLQSRIVHRPPGRHRRIDGKLRCRDRRREERGSAVHRVWYHDTWMTGGKKQAVCGSWLKVDLRKAAPMCAFTCEAPHTKLLFGEDI